MPRQVLVQFAKLQGLDAVVRTADGQQRRLTRDKQPDSALKPLMAPMSKEVADQPPAETRLDGKRRNRDGKFEVNTVTRLPVFWRISADVEPTPRRTGTTVSKSNAAKPKHFSTLDSICPTLAARMEAKRLVL